MKAVKPPKPFLYGDSINDELGHHEIKYNDKHEVVERLLNGVVQPNKPYFPKKTKKP